jgi:hypothetical protein
VPTQESPRHQPQSAHLGRQQPAQCADPVDYYRLLRTIEAVYGLSALGCAADTARITEIWTGG